MSRRKAVSGSRVEKHTCPNMSKGEKSLKLIGYNFFVPEKRARAGGELLPEKLGRGVRPDSQNSVHDQNLRFSLPYLRPDQKFDTLFMT